MWKRAFAFAAKNSWSFRTTAEWPLSLIGAKERIPQMQGPAAHKNLAGTQSSSVETTMMFSGSDPNMTLWYKPNAAMCRLNSPRGATPRWCQAGQTVPSPAGANIHPSGRLCKLQHCLALESCSSFPILSAINNAHAACGSNSKP